jgi:hypothetical protein
MVKLKLKKHNFTYKTGKDLNIKHLLYPGLGYTVGERVIEAI